MMATYSPRLISISQPETALISWSPMMYVFQRSYVRMTMPSRFSCSPRLTASVSACAIYCSCHLPFNLRRSVAHFNPGLVSQRTDHFEATRHDLVAIVQSAQNLDVGRSGHAGLHPADHRLLSAYHEHPLTLFLEPLVARA